MTGPYFSVGPCRKISPFSPGGTITTWIAALQSELLTCNWTTVSTFTGSGGTLGIVMSTFPTPNGQTAHLTVFWDGSQAPFGAGPIITFQMSDSNGNNNQNIGFVTLPGGKTFTLYIGPHQFFLVSTLGTPFQLNYVMGGVPVTLGSSQAYWGCGDSGNGGAPSFTNTLGLNHSAGTWAYLLNGVNANRSSVGNIAPQLLVERAHNFNNDFVLFSDGTTAFIEPMLVLIDRVVVYIWDAVVISYSFTSNLDFKFFGRLFEVLTIGFGALAIVADDSGKPPTPSYSY